MYKLPYLGIQVQCMFSLILLTLEQDYVIELSIRLPTYLNMAIT